MIGRDDDRVGGSLPAAAPPFAEVAGRVDVCSACDGTGWAVVGIFYPGTYYARPDERPCPVCKGKRFVRVRRG